MAGWQESYEQLSEEQQERVQRWLHLNKFIAHTLRLDWQTWIDQFIAPAIAKDRNCTPAQLALAWVLAQSDRIVPIPGTKRRKYLDENIGALRVQLTADELARIEKAFPRSSVSGERYMPAMMALTGR